MGHTPPGDETNVTCSSLTVCYTRADVPGADDGAFSTALLAEALQVWELVQAGVIRFEVTPLASFPGFARLFAA